jgi:hypothetical protein
MRASQVTYFFLLRIYIDSTIGHVYTLYTRILEWATPGFELETGWAQLLQYLCRQQSHTMFSENLCNYFHSH